MCLTESLASCDFADSLVHDVTASMATSGTQDVTKIRADLTAQFETEKQKLIEQYEQKLAAVQVRFRLLVSDRCCSFSG